jgi:hypothetical protein
VAFLGQAFGFNPKSKSDHDRYGVSDILSNDQTAEDVVPVSPVTVLRFIQDVALGDDNQLRSLDRESLLAVHRVLTALRDDVEQALSQLVMAEDIAVGA